MVSAQMGFIPALRWHTLTPMYDAVMNIVMPENEMRRDLIESAQLESGHCVLDLGCGTGSLALAVNTHREIEMHGVDVDPRMLMRARAKARTAHANIAFTCADARALPYADARFDRVVSSLVLHHLTSAEKVTALRECRRVLAPGGSLHIVDWGKPAGLYARIAFTSVRLVDGFAPTADHAHGTLRDRMLAAGFGCVEESTMRATWFGTLRVLRASVRAGGGE